MRLWLGAALAAGVFLLMPLSAQAQALRTWVSGVGDDANPCARTAPCKTFAGAISKTAINGEINCLDPGGFSAVTITKSITIDCSETGGTVLGGGGTGITINIPSGNTSDLARTARVRGLTINGTLNGNRSGGRGISVLNAAAVFVESVVVTDFAAQGLANESVATGSRVYIRDSVIRNNGQSGVYSNGATPSIAVIENSHLTGNDYGAAAGAGNNLTVTRSVMSGSRTSGLWAASGGQMIASHNLVTNNNIGVEVLAGGSIRLADNDIAFNNTGISGSATSFGTNRIAGNAVAGTTPGAAGSASNGLGLQ